ncbi:MAG: FHA domain-containing protein [Chloroflexi bacterium]|nr:FHA domain-containing protein [Chloroflexota bacterium]
MIAPRYPPTQNPRSTTAPANPLKVDSAVSSEGETEMKPHLTLHVLSTRQQLHITIQDKLILGRCAEPETDGTPNIDLSPFLGYQLGVSRRHLMLVRQESDEILAFDLSSSNGSFVNGQRMSGHKGHTLQDGDELMLGSLTIRVYFRNEIPFAHLQTRQLIPVQLETEDEFETSPLAGPVPNIRETLTTQTRQLSTIEAFDIEQSAKK